MARLGRVLVVGGGVGGMAAAIRLKETGVDVELIDLDPDWKVYGAGISITGPSLRAFQALGVLDQMRERGDVGAGVRVCNPAGAVLFEMPADDGGDLVRAAGGILRPILHEIVSARVRALGVPVKLGVSVAALDELGDAVHAVLTDGTEGDYGLVIGADGIYSKVRGMIAPDAPRPRFTGQGCWRVVAPRPASMDRMEIYLGGPVKVGLVPIDAARIYMFLLEHVPSNPRFEPDDYIPHLRELMAGFGGNAAGVRDGLSPQSNVTYRPLEWVMAPPPWRKGRVQLIGDAAHATTPHLASGAGLAVEDALVLVEELGKAVPVETALEAFFSRRFDRVRAVVENSVRIGELEMAGGDPATLNALMGQNVMMMAAPY